MNDEKQLDIQKFLTKGKEARYALYLNYLKEIGQGGTLSSDQVRTMKQLEEEFRSDLSSVQSPNDTPPPVSTTFPNLIAVLSYLQESGYRIKKSTLYNHSKQRKLKPNDSGEYEIASVDSYALANLQRLNGSSITPEQKKRERIDLEKAEAELQKSREQAAYLANKNRKIDEEINAIIGRELAKRYRFFRSDIRNFHRGDAPAIVSLVEGNPQKAPELVDYMDTQLDIWLGRYASMTTVEIGNLINENDFSEAV